MTEGRPTIEDLNANIGGIKNLIEDRNKLMDFMFKEDQYNDFLLAEKLQSMGDVGGLKVQPISGSGMDLSPINDLLPNTIEHDVAGKIDPKIVRMPRNQTSRKEPDRNSMGGNWTDKLNPFNWFGGGDNKTNKLSKGGFIPSLTGVSPTGSTSVNSLEESGFDDTFQKNISSKLEDDFAIPDSLKRAFGEAMELPLRASAAMISDLISKIPAQDANTKSIINESLSEVANAFNLSKTSLTNEVSSSDSSETTGGNSFVNSLSKVVSSSTSSTQIADASGGRKNLNLLNPFDWGAVLEEGDKARSGTRTNTEGNNQSVPTTILNRNNTLQQMINEMSSTGGTSDMMNSIQSVAQNFSGDNLTASLPGMNNIISSSKSGDQSLTQLTEMVINATHKNQLQNVESIKAKALAAIPNLPIPKPIANANTGSADSISKIKESPFFELYTAMSQFS
tara:strand:+ start:197 stop:1546 length:1350 start_codon:yes stop_codon:yes gene_type:complete